MKTNVSISLRCLCAAVAAVMLLSSVSCGRKDHAEGLVSVRYSQIPQGEDLLLSGLVGEPEFIALDSDTSAAFTPAATINVSDNYISSYSLARQPLKLFDRSTGKYIGTYSGGAALPVAACITLSACNDIYNGMMDATYTYTGDYNKVGNTNALKDFLVKKGGETGEILFGDEKLGEKMGSWAYTGLDVVSFLNGVDKLGKSFGKLQTITSGTAETSKVWGEIHMDDVIDNDLKYLSKDGIIKTILNIDPNSVANFGYDVVTGTIKSIKSAGKLGNTIADLAVG